MAKVTKLFDAMSSPDRINYILGMDAALSDKNPFNEHSEIRKHQAWSAGHFDKWGRVDD